MKIVPRALYGAPNITVIAQNGPLGILHKSLDAPLRSETMFVSSHTLTVIVSGEKQIDTFENDSILIPRERVLFMPKDLYVVSDLIPRGGVFESYLFFFDDSVIEGFLASFTPSQASENTAPLFAMPYAPALKAYMQNLHALFGETDNDARLLRLKLTELLHLMATCDGTGTFLEWLFSILQKPKRDLGRFMQAHYDKPLSVKDFAALTGRSPSTFLRDFKAQFSTTPKQWLNARRMEKAHRLMRAQELSVSEAAMESGYENVSHFIKRFKSHFGLTPKQFLIRTRNADVPSA